MNVIRVKKQGPGLLRPETFAAPGVCFLLLALLLTFAGNAYPSSQTLLVNNAAAERVVVEHDPLLNPASGITLEIWVRPNTVTNCSTLVGKGFATAYWLGICSGKIRYYTNGSGTNITGNGTITVGEWTHIAVTFDGSVRRYYINGELDLSMTTPASPGINEQPLGIGGEGSSTTFPNGLFPFDGRLSELHLWNYARSQEQIRETMYQQITVEQPGLVGVWPLEGAADDRFGDFFSTLAPGAIWSGIQSPPLPHAPLRIRQTAFVAMDGNCDDSAYVAAVATPAWYQASDRLLSEKNPQEILLGADLNYIFVCLKNRKLLDDSIYSVEIDPNNDAGSLLQNDDYRFRFWPGGSGLETARGQQGTLGNIITSSWSSPVANPTGLAAAEDLSVEFTVDFEMRIPRSIFSDPLAPFGMRVSHNFLINGGVSDRTVIWPPQGQSTNPSSWQEATVDLTPPPAADGRNPSILSLTFTNDRPHVSEAVNVRVRAFDSVDIELVEILVDGVVVESMEYPQVDNVEETLLHTASYTLGRHVVSARVFDHAGNLSRLVYRTFQVVVDGDSPRLSLSINPREPAPGQTIIITAIATDAAQIRSMEIKSVLGGHLPTAKFCDRPAGGVTETCVWTITPGPDLTMVRLNAYAVDADGFSSRTSDYVVLWGNSGVDTDDDGLSDFTESGLCTSAFSPDSDSDGLSDGWEVLGIQFAGGDELPLAEYGSNPCYKNLLLQLDYEAPTYPPSTGVLNLVNQYRKRNTSAYVEVHERPEPVVYNQSHIHTAAAVYQVQDGEYYFDPRRSWAFYYGYQRNLPGRSGSWNRFFTLDYFSNLNPKGYCASGPDQGKQCSGDFQCGGGASCSAGCNGGGNAGLSCSGAVDCPRADGGYARCVAPCVSKAGASGPRCWRDTDLDYRLFHELGHAVGLGHGGIQGSFATSSDGGFVTVDSDWDNTNFKPHQVSTMNYYYSQGLMCMKPPPTPIPAGYEPDISAEISFMDITLGDLDENLLSELPSSLFSTRLREQNCSFADADTFPVFRYTCTTPDAQMEVISNGLKTMARHSKGGSWDFDVPAHALGIDWNCNGTIEVDPVAENIDSAGSRFDGFSWNSDLWVLDSNLRGRSEFPSIPKPVSCQNLYAPNCSDRAKSCYPWPSAYQNGIPDLASGTAPVDCRDRFMATRATHDKAACRGGADAEFGSGICPQFSVDSTVPVALNESQVDGWDATGMLAGPAGDTGPEHDDGEPAYAIPGVERCDMEDNDGDGEIDEGCTDSDADGMPDMIDNCPTFANPEQADRDGNYLGDACQSPQLSNPQASWDGANNVMLSWGDDGVPLRGVVIYRYGETTPRRLYRGSAYPSSATSDFTDSVSVGDTYTYVLRPLNLNGVEGEAVSVQVVVNIDDKVFADSFENP